MREREDREALAGRLSEYEERENERQRRSLWFTRRNPRVMKYIASIFVFKNIVFESMSFSFLLLHISGVNTLLIFVLCNHSFFFTKRSMHVTCTCYYTYKWMCKVLLKRFISATPMSFAKCIRTLQCFNVNAVNFFVNFLKYCTHACLESAAVLLELLFISSYFIFSFHFIYYLFLLRILHNMQESFSNKSSTCLLLKSTSCSVICVQLIYLSSVAMLTCYHIRQKRSNNSNS